MKGRGFIQHWIVTTLGVLVASNIVPGIHYETAVGLFLASLLLGMLNAVIRPFLIVLALPLLLFTLGLFILVINAMLFYFVGSLLKSFHVESFSAAFWGALIVSLVSMVANWVLGTGESRVRVTHQRQRPPSPPPPSPRDGGGPVIDV